MTSSAAHPGSVYIGIRSPGTTSRLRSDALLRSFACQYWTPIDTDFPFQAAVPPWRFEDRVTDLQSWFVNWSQRFIPTSDGRVTS
jgi:hypothetical protein